MRSIDLVVDITNYVLLETGQPLHAFDADKIAGKQIMVRFAKPGEKLATINEDELELTAEDLVIADKEKPIALAGVMGGKDSELLPGSRNVFLESAHFDSATVRRASLRHKIFSDSSYRFERGTDPAGVDLGRRRALSLIAEYGKPSAIHRVIFSGGKPVKASSILLKRKDVSDWLGCDIKASKINSILTRLALVPKSVSLDSWKVSVPSFRSDLTRPVDLIEEIARIYGYENIPETYPAIRPTKKQSDPVVQLENKIRPIMVGSGCCETVTFSLIANKGLDEGNLARAVEIVNPQHKELCWMRPTVLGSLLEVAEKNQKWGTESFSFFEIANIYYRDDSVICEDKVCAFLLGGKKRVAHWLDSSRDVTFFDLKGLCEDLLERLGVQVSGRLPAGSGMLIEGMQETLFARENAVGFYGAVKPTVAALWNLEQPMFYAEINLSRVAAVCQTQFSFQEPPRFPSVRRDLSLTVDESVKSAQIESEIRHHGGKLVRGIYLFDQYRGSRIPENKKNLAYQITYQSDEATLRSEDVQVLHDAIAHKITQKFQADFQ